MYALPFGRTGPWALNLWVKKPVDGGEGEGEGDASAGAESGSPGDDSRWVELNSCHGLGSHAMD